MRAELCRNLRRNCRDAARQLKSVNTVVKIKRIKQKQRYGKHPTFVCIIGGGY